MSADLAKLRALHWAASPGPWALDIGFGDKAPGAYVYREDGGDVVLAETRESPLRLSDAALIVAVRNSLPELLEELEDFRRAAR